VGCEKETGKKDTLERTEGVRRKRVTPQRWEDAMWVSKADGAKKYRCRYMNLKKGEGPPKKL